MRVHELAKLLSITSKDLLAKLKERHIEAKNHMTSLDEDVVKLFLESKGMSTSVVVPSGSRRTETGKGGVSKQAVSPEAKKAAAKSPEIKTVSVTQLSQTEKQEMPSVSTVASPAPSSAPVSVAEVVNPLKSLEVSVPISIKDLSALIKVNSGELIKYLMFEFKLFANINQQLGREIVDKILPHFGYAFVEAVAEEDLPVSFGKKIPVGNLRPRSPIVTFMGHVDHGKTSLLDAIRRTKVVESEQGGITQHIGAYEVKLPKGRITFLDTPGHEAFTSMRARGANATDIVVLVVAADDGVMPQTVEALDHAKAAGVPILVAINKIDKPQVNLDRVKKQLSDLDLMPEDWGGKTITVCVSAKAGTGIDTLLEMILLESEMLELKAAYDQEATGVVIEAKLSKGRGPVATVLVQNGTLRVGDFVIAGNQGGGVRAMANAFRQQVEEAGPATPVEITGLSGVPEAGDKFWATKDDKKGRDLLQKKQEEFRRLRLEPMLKKPHLHLEDLYKEIKQGGVKELNIILKADVQGSLEAIEDSLAKIGNQEVKLNVMHKGAGLINSSDVVLATASNAIIIGFNVDPDSQASEMAAKEDIDIRTYRIIYEIVNDMKAALEGMLAPRVKRVFVGRAEVKKVFQLSKSGVVAGSLVKKGHMTRGAEVVLVRNGQTVFEGKLAALKRFKDDVRDVQEGFECGISLQNYEDIREGDFIDAFELSQIARKL